jgi:hypothetical protein
VTDYVAMSKVKWATTRIAYGWDVLGIWPPCSRGEDINCVDKMKKTNIIVTGDDFSKIKLYRYPCVDENASNLRF